MTQLALILHLDGYGPYVWPSYALALILLVWMGLSTRRRLLRLARRLETLQPRTAPPASPGDQAGSGAGPLATPPPESRS